MPVSCNNAQAVILNPSVIRTENTRFTPMSDKSDIHRTIRPDDPSLNYHGRWDIGETEAVAYWCRAYVCLQFTGSSLQINLGSQPSVASFQLCVTMDGCDQHFTAMGCESISYPCLHPGVHTVKIMNIHHSDPLILTSLLVNDDSLVTKPENKPVEIQFVGDMLTAMDISYSARIAHYLDCEHTTIARNAIALCNGWGAYKLPSGQHSHIGMEKAYFNLQGVSQNGPYTPAAFSYEHPDALLVNIGSNDWLTNRRNCAQFIESYQEFIRKLRALHPHKPIYLVLPFADNSLGLRLVAIAAAAKASLFDKNIRFVDTRTWNIEIGSNHLHPTPAGFATATERLCSILREGM